jgi:DNA invertase Pin-like site-specific DNA recombinase
MIYGYARVSTDGQSVAAQISQLRAAGCEKVFREVSSGVKTDRNQLRHAVEHLAAGDVLIVTRLDRLARSTRRRPRAGLLPGEIITPNLNGSGLKTELRGRLPAR